LDLKERAKYYIVQYYKDFGGTLGQINRSKQIIDTLILSYSVKNQRYGSNDYLIDYFAKQKLHWSEIKINYDIDIQTEVSISSKIQSLNENLCKKYQICDIAIVVFGKDDKIKYLYWWDYKKSQVDSVTAKLEVWSTLKPFIYMRYFDLYWVKDFVPNSKICIGSYCPNNRNFSFSSKVSFNTALNHSYNIPVFHIVRDNLWLRNV